MKAHELSNAIMEGWKEFLLAEQGTPSNRPYIYASSYHPCVRNLYLGMTAGDQLPPFEAEVLAKFRRGNDRERDLLNDLSRVGRICEPPFSVVAGQQRFEIKHKRTGKPVIVGKVDARLDFGRGKPKAPLEVKAWHPNLTERIHTFPDLLESPWTRSGALQLLMYLLGANEEIGFMLIDRSGLPRLIPVTLEDQLDLAESFLIAAEAAMDHKEAGTTPAFLDDPTECRKCKFYGVACNPPMVHDAATILTDDDVIQDLEQRDKLAEAAKEYNRIDKRVKERLRGIEAGIAGDFLITGKWGKSTKYAIPQEIKDKYKQIDPKGRFTIKIERI